MNWLGNLIAFQLGWFACVLGGAEGWPWLGTAVALLLIVAHLARAAVPFLELALVLSVGLVGAALDSLLVILGLLHYPSGMLIEGMASHWIVAMWMLFATTLNITLRWLKGRWLLAGLLGTVGGPLAYYAGAGLGGVTFHDQPALSLVALAITWSVAMPLVMALSNRFDGVAGTGRKSALPCESGIAERPGSPRCRV